MDLQGVFFGHHPGPDRIEEGILADDLSRTVHKHAKKIKGPRRNLDRAVRSLNQPVLSL